MTVLAEVIVSMEAMNTSASMATPTNIHASKIAYAAAFPAVEVEGISTRSVNDVFAHDEDIVPRCGARPSLAA